MKAFAIGAQSARLASSILTKSVLGFRWGLVLVALVLGSCAVAETSPSAPSSSEVPLPPVSLPSFRLPSQLSAINSLSASQAEDKVSISGSVTQRVALLDGWLYQMQDDSGSLWVLTNRSEPTVGETATVSGIVRYEAIAVGEIDASEVYLEEQSYRSEGS